MATSSHSPIFTILIAVYNTGEYIRETIDSILEQDLPADGYEILLIDDGSTDDSADIIAEYTEKYSNIRYIYKDNGGAASAFNVGIDNACGDIVAFLGSDDLLSSDALSQVAAFMDDAGKDVDLVSIRLRFFEAKTGEHMLNDRFNYGDRVIDVTYSPTEIQLAAGGCFIRREALTSNNLRMREDLRIAEDATFLQQVIMLRRKYGVLQTPVYHYRKRSSGNSLLDQTVQVKETFSDVLRNAWLFLFDTYRQEDGRIPEYLQYVVAYEIQWRFKVSKSPLNEEEAVEYRELLRQILQDIDDQVIVAQKHINIEYKVYILGLKYGENVFQEALAIRNSFVYRGIQLFRVNERSCTAHIHILDIEGNTVRIEGFYTGCRFKGLEHGFLINGVFEPVEYVKRELYSISFVGFEVWDCNSFTFVTPLRENMRIRPAVKLSNGTIIQGIINASRSTCLPNFNTGYRIAGEHVITNVMKREMRFSKLSAMELIKREIPLLGRVWLKNIYRPKEHSRFNLTLYRLNALAHKAIGSKKKIWLVSDRADAAEDNGEAFFRHLVKHVPQGVQPYFLLSKKAPSFESLDKMGELIDPRGRQAKKLFLRADKIISSQADDYVINYFGKDEFIMRGLYDFDFVFLQHGITKDDQSGWFNKFSKNIKALVTSSEGEWDSIAHGKYCYDEKDVVLTGMPRFDRLENKPLKKIIIAPTWRKYLRGNFDPVKQVIAYNPGFKDSEYFQFWQTILLDPRLNKVLEEADYVGEFWLHPSHFNQASDFQGTERITVGVPPHDYKKGISEGSVFVTDFSSAVFDFAYLKKSVVYTHFDIEQFQRGHIYSEGYFSYEKDGFGPVCFDYESTVDAIIDAVKRDGLMSAQYRDRVDKFFAFTDRNNSARVIEAVCRLDQE